MVWVARQQLFNYFTNERGGVGDCEGGRENENDVERARERVWGIGRGKRKSGESNEENRACIKHRP